MSITVYTRSGDRHDYDDTARYRVESGSVLIVDDGERTITYSATGWDRLENPAPPSTRRGSAYAVSRSSWG
jgi:hypothetical protein